MIRQLRSAPNLLTLARLIFIPFIVIAVPPSAIGGRPVSAVAASKSASLAMGQDAVAAQNRIRIS